MQKKFKKEIYNSSPHFHIHHSYGIRKPDPALKYLHYDNELIIEFVQKGKISIFIEGNIYNFNEGDIALITPEELHFSTREDDDYIEILSLHINESLLSVFGGNRTVFFDTITSKPKGVGNLITSDVVRQLGIDTTLNQCLKYAEDSSLEAQVLLSCTVIELLAQLAKLVGKENNSFASPISKNKNINEIINYINRHCTEDITLDMLASRFHFSKYYISHLFKDYVGISPYDYLIIRRLYTFNELIRKKHSIREACFMTGFNNYSNFYRLYKKHFQITPQQFKNSLNELDNQN